MTGDAVTAGEITQDTFVWFMYNPEAYDANRADLGPFLAGMARNVLRRQQRAQQRWGPLDIEMHATAVTQTHDFDAELLQKAIQALPVKYERSSFCVNCRE